MPPTFDAFPLGRSTEPIGWLQSDPIGWETAVLDWPYPSRELSRERMMALGAPLSVDLCLQRLAALERSLRAGPPGAAVARELTALRQSIEGAVQSALSVSRLLGGRAL